MMSVLAIGAKRLVILLILIFYECEEMHVNVVIGTCVYGRFVIDIHWTVAWVKVSLIFEHDI
jgi:hypothetical protein